jgi:hypothetical protein
VAAGLHEVELRQPLVIVQFVGPVPRTCDGRSVGRQAEMGQDALLRLRDVALRAKGGNKGDQEREGTLAHLIAGTESVDGFGEIFIDDLRPMHVEGWRAGVGKLIAQGTYSPTTATAG